jgi:UDP-N-acetylmuramoylalanine--D-glutamate ligase
VVLGLGATGLSVARFLAARGESFCVVDSRAQPPMLDALRAELPDVPVFLGGWHENLLQTAAELVVSPGLSLQEPAVQRAVEAGASVCGDIDLFMAEARAPVVGITGSNAKSTVTSLVGAMAEATGLNVGVGGNLGTPALDLLDARRDAWSWDSAQPACRWRVSCPRAASPSASSTAANSRRCSMPCAPSCPTSRYFSAAGTRTCCRLPRNWS